MTIHTPIRVVMVGCGAFARRYHLPAIEADPGAGIAAIFDPHPTEAVRELAGRHDIPLVDDFAALPEFEQEPDVATMAIVTTPHTLHVAHVRQVLDRGWHALVDKPFVLRAVDARSLAALAAERGLVNAVAYNRRFDRGCLRAREIIATGGIGAVRYVQTVQLGYERAGWFLVPSLGGGGPYTGRASHMADLLPWLLGQKPHRLRSRLRGGTETRTDHGGFIELLFDDFEAHLTCIEEGWHMWDEVRVFGEDGLIELRRPLSHPIGWELAWHSRRGDALEVLKADPHPGDATRDFFAAVRGGHPVACSFADAVPSVAIVEQAFASARAGDAWVPIE